MQNNYPIGIFDSGLGGLIVLKELKKILPKENFIYFGDTAHIPYGNKSERAIQEYSSKIVKFLNEKQVKTIVVACNSASSVAIKKIKEITSTPIIDVIDPAVKKACSLTKNNQVGIIGTEATINSNAYQNYIVKFNSSIQVIAQHCPLLVPIIEEGLHNHKIGINAIHLYLNTFNKKNIDTLILGCTHYPIMKETIKNYLNKNITIINSATETALAVQKFIKDNNLNNMGKFKQNNQYYVSDKTIRFHNLANQFLNSPIDHIYQIKL